MRDKNETIIRRLKQELSNGDVLKRYRVQETDFTRERVLTWPVVILIMLRGQKVALQTAVNKFLVRSARCGGS